MIYSSCLRDDDRLIALDASVAINLAASGQATRIVRLLPYRIAIAVEAVREIEAGQSRGHDDIAPLRRLIEDGLIEVSEMSAQALDIFGDLVRGTVSQSLGDGEAATMAVGVTMSAVAAIDEKKARLICGERFRSLRLATSIDLLAHPMVVEGLGRTDLAHATLQALRHARMHVRQDQFAWVVDLVGLDAVKELHGLRKLLNASRARAGAAE